MAIQTSLKSQDFRETIQESRQRFLDKLCDSSVEAEETIRTKKNEPVRKKSVSRKISTKVRRTSSAYRKNRNSNIQKTTIKVSSVAELASKFNEIIEKQNVPNADVKLQKLARRLSSFNSNNLKEMKHTNPSGTNENNRRVLRKPSIKKKPNIDETSPTVQINKKVSYISNIVLKNPEIKKETQEIIKPLNGDIKVEELHECVSTNSKQDKPTPLGFVKAAIQNFEKNSFRPIVNKRSVSEIHRINIKENQDLESNRRKSCKPDLEIPQKPRATKNVLELNNDLIEIKEVKISSKSEPNLTLTEDLKIHEHVAVTFTSTPVVGNLFSHKIQDIPASFSEKLVDNGRDISETKNLKSRTEEISTEKPKNIDDDFQDSENKYECYETVEAFNLHVNDSCYSVTDIINSTLVNIENERNFYKNNNESTIQNIKPNASFLWTKSSYNFHQFNTVGVPYVSTTRSSNNFTSRRTAFSKTLPKDYKDGTIEQNEKIYEELDTEDGYEVFDSNVDYEEVKIRENEEERDYEYLHNKEDNIYETLPLTKQNEPLPHIPSSTNSDTASNCYESIYNPDAGLGQNDGNYESIYFQELNGQDNLDRDTTESVISSEQKTNSLYGRTSLRSWNDGTIYNGSANSDVSFSDKSEWIDVSENDEDGESKIVILRDPVKNKKSGSWSQQCRQQWSKASKSSSIRGGDSDSDHHYETLQTSDNEGQNCRYDSFTSDTESENSFDNLEDRGNNGDLPLPAVPNNNDVLTRLAATASKHMRKFTKNFSMTRSDISKSLTRIATARRKSKNDISEVTEENGCDNINNESAATTPSSEVNPITRTEIEENNEKNKSLTRKGFLSKIRRSIIISPEQANEIKSNINNKGNSIFYLTPTINVDDLEDRGERKTEDDSGISLSPVDRDRNARIKPIRPQNPPPPAPIVALNEDLKKRLKEKRTTSWYAEVNLCKGSENKTKTKEKRSNTCWYDEIGLYQNSTSTPSTSSAENSGTNTNVIIRRPTSATPSVHSNQDRDNNEKLYNIRNGSNYYNDSIHSSNSNGGKTDWSLTNLPGDDIQMMLQNEPLYQFYDAAVLDSVCHEGISDVDSENYDDVERRLNLQSRPPSRPSAMELIVPKRNSLAFTKTLWCEIPEVLQSSVLSTLSLHQKKLQEAKFEMVTSEASYLNSLNVLNDHFMKNLRSTLTDDEYESLFGKIEAVRQSSDKLLLDLEMCWQDNILLHGVCDIIKKHAEEDFNVYIPFCENHVLLEHTMKKIRDRAYFADAVRQLEGSPVCQCLSLYSFLMLPMQRITRWPLLLDAVLKRLEEHDPEYITCQYVLATINKIVHQCNEAARQKEREIEMLNIESKMEFAKGVPAFELAISNRWLVRSGSIVHMQPRSEEIKLTFGKKISKATLHLFLFNDLLIVAKPKGENLFSVMHYCSRNFTELGTSEHLFSIPGKEMTGKYLFFLTILENQNKKTIEFLFSCSSESDKQRWIEALSPPTSEDPDEVVYECWDCPQVTVIHNYTAVQPDELNLAKGDVINVSRKMADGWFQGERIRDGQTGWFPANYVVEIANPHVRSRNLKQRYRLLTFSENYLKNN